MEIELPAPEEPHPPFGRTGHPYFLHDMILSQPSALRATVSAAERDARAIPEPAADRTLLFVGLGTSFHAARASAWAAGPAFDYHRPVRAIDSFDLLLEPGQVRRASAAIVFSASGETALTHRAQDALREAGVPQVLVTGTEKSGSTERADYVLRTREADEKAWVHTVSYTSAISAALSLLHHWSGNASVQPRGVDRSMEQVIRQESDWRGLSETLADRTKILILGSGPAEATAREASLKLREGAARFVASIGIEEFLHGVLPSIDSDRTAVVAVATSSLDARRASTALAAGARAGAKVALFTRERPPRGPEAAFELPTVPSPQTPLVDILPFQFLTYWFALSAGRNPDVMGFDDPRILAGRRSYGI